MIANTEFLVLKTLKYQDTSLIVKGLTKKFGLKSYLLKGIRSGKRKKNTLAYFLPLMWLEIEANHRTRYALNYINEIRVVQPYKSIHRDVKKNAYLYYLTEFIYLCLLENDTDEKLFDFIVAHIKWLDEHSKVTNFYLYFVIKLTKILGIEPNMKNDNFPYFNLMEGLFQDKIPNQPYVEGNDLNAFKQLVYLNLSELEALKFTLKTRHSLLKTLHFYYELHFPNFKNLKSLEILKLI